MRDIIKRNPLAVIIAVIMHLTIITFMVVGVDWLKKPEQKRFNIEVVQAKVIDSERVKAEVEKLKQADEKKKSDATKEKKRLADLKREQEAEKKRLADLKNKRQIEEKKRKEAVAKRKLEEKKRKEAEAKRKTAEKKRKEADAKRLAEEKKRKAAEAEQKRKAEAERKRKAAAEKKRKAEAEKKRKAEAERKRKAEAARKAREAQAAREAELQAAIEAENNAREVDRFTAMIRQDIERSWVRPAGIGEGMKCTLSVRLAPGGVVLDASVNKSSGNGAFDRSAVNAVYKADPLPAPDGALFESFRSINLIFAPDE